MIRPMYLTAVACLAVWLGPLAAGSNLRTESEDDRYLSGLRQRQLFQLAETYCRRQLEREDLAEVVRSDMVIELSRTLAEHALASDGADQPRLWEESSAVAEEFIAGNQDHPRVFQLELQRALVHLAWGISLSERSRILAGAENDLVVARQRLGTATAILDSLDERIADELLRRSRRPQAKPGELSPAELRALGKNVRRERGRAMLELGSSHPKGSPDRSHALSVAVEILGPLAQLSPDDPASWPARLDLVRADREAAGFDRAAAEIDRLLGQAPGPFAEAQLHGEGILLALDQGDADRALRLATTWSPAEGVQCPAFDLAKLLALLAGWRAQASAGVAREADRLRAEAEQAALDIGARHGIGWGRRAETLLADSARDAQGGGSLDGLTRAAETYYRNGFLDEALSAYDDAASKARTMGRPGEAFTAARSAAALEYQRSRFGEATRRYRQAALDWPGNPDAAGAHLMAVHAAAREAGQDSQADLSHYHELLQEHLRKWPASATAAEAWWWLGRLLESRREWRGAAEAYQHVTSDDSLGLESLAAVRRVLEAQIAERAAEGNPDEDLTRYAANYFDQLARAGDAGLRGRWDARRREAALAAAQFFLRDPSPEYQRALDLLTPAIDDAAGADAAWRTAAGCLRVAALAGLGRVEEATESLRTIAAGTPHDVLPLMHDLADLTDQAAAPLQADLARLVIQAGDLARLGQAELSPEDAQEIDILQARALVAAGQTRLAVERLLTLERQSPDSGEIKEWIATALLASDDPADWPAALPRWRDLERRARPGSDLWYRAKLRLALVHEKLGNKEQAAKIVELTRLLHPELGGAKLKREFESLLDRLQR
jgi:hypothetical protein